MTKTVLVAGATGNLGSEIVAELVARGANVRALVRGSKADGGDKLRELAESGAITLVVGDVNDDLASLTENLKGVDVVVSALQGGPDVIIEGQKNLIRAAGAAGVPRMIPSDFSADLHKLDFGDNLFLDMRKTADVAFGQSTVRPTSVLVGGFMEVMLAPFMGIVDMEAGTFSYWGDGEQEMDFTSIPDAAAYAAAAALDDSTADKIVSFAGDVVTMKQLHAAIAKTTGRELEIRVLGTVDDLKAEIDRRRAVATNPYEYVGLQYQWAMMSGKGKLTDIRNADYPDITPVTVENFLANR
jgi:nucleoside-diphosphate-sugar epimerase